MITMDTLARMQRAGISEGDLIYCTETTRHYQFYPDDATPVDSPLVVESTRLNNPGRYKIASPPEEGTGGIPEAPIDTKTYGRKDAGWSEVSGGGLPLPSADERILRSASGSFQEFDQMRIASNPSNVEMATYSNNGKGMKVSSGSDNSGFNDVNNLDLEAGDGSNGTDGGDVNISAGGASGGGADGNLLLQTALISLFMSGGIDKALYLNADKFQLQNLSAALATIHAGDADGDSLDISIPLVGGGAITLKAAANLVKLAAQPTGSDPLSIATVQTVTDLGSLKHFGDRSFDAFAAPIGNGVSVLQFNGATGQNLGNLTGVTAGFGLAGADNAFIVGGATPAPWLINIDCSLTDSTNDFDANLQLAIYNVADELQDIVDMDLKKAVGVSGYYNHGVHLHGSRTLYLTNGFKVVPRVEIYNATGSIIVLQASAPNFNRSIFSAVRQAW